MLLTYLPEHPLLQWLQQSSDCGPQSPRWLQKSLPIASRQLQHSRQWHPWGEGTESHDIEKMREAEHVHVKAVAHIWENELNLGVKKKFRGSFWENKVRNFFGIISTKRKL